MARRQHPQAGDTYLPLAGWASAPMSTGRVGIQLTWALSEQDLLRGRMQIARLHLSADQARELAASLQEQATISEQRQRPM
jgi:hypothetical protein